MSRRDDYSDEMFTKHLSDDVVEAVLSRRVSDNRELAEIGRVLDALDPQRFTVASEEKAAAFARQAAALSRAGEPAKFAATARYKRGLSLTPRLAPVAVAAILLLGMTGVAVASDSAVPGDVLYGIDRAVENIGLGNGGNGERIEEAGVLLANGDSTGALQLLSEALGTESSAASEALLHAAERVREAQGDDSAVADMLQWMAETDLEGREFGQAVAERARSLGNGVTDGETQTTGNGGEAPDQTGDNPGQGDDPPGQGGEPPGQGGEGLGQGNQGGQGQSDEGQTNEGQGNQGQGNSDDAPGQGKP